MTLWCSLSHKGWLINNVKIMPEEAINFLQWPVLVVTEKQAPSELKEW